MISETKLDNTFPTSQLFMQGYSTPLERAKLQKGAYFCTSEMSLAK